MTYASCRRRVPAAAFAQPQRGTTQRAARLGLLALLAWAGCAPAGAQMMFKRGLPSDAHFESFPALLNGDCVSAGRLFTSVPRIKSTEGVYIDSIPYHAMIGECKYQMGDLAGALEQYSAALQVLLSYPDWLLYLEYNKTVTPSTSVIRNPPTWGTPTRPIRVANVPERLAVVVGNTPAMNELAMQQGGVMTTQQALMIDAKEIVRCTALALRRRAEILGPTGEHDPLTNKLVTVLSKRLAPPNHWSQTWISIELGLANVAKGKTADAVNELRQGLAMAGMDHHLTSTVLLELGKLAFRSGDFAAAGTLFLDATYSGAMLSGDDYMQYEVMAEAFRWAMVTHLVLGRQDFFAPLAMANEWAQRSRINVLQASVALSAAENYAAIGDAQRASAMLDLAATSMRRRECNLGELGARLQYTSAHLAYLQGDPKRGTKALDAAMQYQKKGGSRRLFQILLVDRLFTSGNITTRQADLLFADVLRDPTPLDWAMDPLESLAVLTTPHLPPYEHWMMLALDRKEKDVALRISDAMRRHRFYCSIPPVGARTLNLRWTLEAPPETLSQTATLHRQELLQRYPAYAPLSQEAQQLRTELAGMPLVPETEDQRQQAARVQTRLAEVGQLQERLLWSIGLGRERGEFVFPPATDVTVVQQQLDPRQRILVFVDTSKGTYGFMLGQETYTSWQLEAPAKIKANLVKLLRDIGQYDRNQPVGIKELSNTSWKDTAATLLQQLTGNAPPEAWDEFDELIVVPDGLLWYLPFEMLQIEKGDQKTALIDKVRIRYAPTISLAVPDKTPRKRDTRTVVVTGELFPKTSTAASQDLVTQLRENDPNVFALPITPEPPSAWMARSGDRLVVLHDLDNDLKTSYDWAPVATEKGKPSMNLAQWMLSPWGSPDQIVLPGFHTAAETALKRDASGEQLFLAVCGLMSTGARTVMLSRWRDGGRTSYELMREFVRELPHRSAAAAWQRSVHLAAQSELDVEREPRVKRPATDTTLTADHPFFWGSYMLVDTGIEPN